MMVKKDFLMKSVSFFVSRRNVNLLTKSFFDPTHALCDQKLVYFVHLGEADPPLSLMRGVYAKELLGISSTLFL